jgi:hypothetical protein
MLPSEHQAARQRVLALGRSGDPEALPELIKHLKLPSHDIQRLAASAIGKLVEFGADRSIAVSVLTPLARGAGHPQTRQYAIRALQKCGPAAESALPDLRDIARNPAQRDYVRAAAATAAESIRQAAEDKSAGISQRCQRCASVVSAEEMSRADTAFQRIYCDRCFDEVFLERRNFEMQVELNKTVRARDGSIVQSAGERKIAEWLAAHGIVYRYDSKFRIIGEFQIRPDFYLPELDVYIEYWGLDTPQYKMSMYKKQMLYQQEGKRLISVYPADIQSLDKLMQKKLQLFGYSANV